MALMLKGEQLLLMYQPNTFLQCYDGKYLLSKLYLYYARL